MSPNRKTTAADILPLSKKEAKRNSKRSQKKATVNSLARKFGKREHKGSHDSTAKYPCSTLCSGLSLAKRWKEPPLSYYIMVAENAATLLQRLAEWPTSLAHHPTSTVPNYKEFPTSSFVVEDLLAMDRPLIHYQELCAQDTTDKGMLRCRLNLRAIVQQLGAGFAFGDYRWQHTPEELGKIFPPTSPTSGKSAHERAQYLDRRGKEPWVASVRTPPGWLSDTHTDFSSVAQVMVDCDGEKLCLFWPATSQILNWWGLPRIQHTSRLEEALDALEGLEVMHITEPCTFIVPPFSLHAVITFVGSTHRCVFFAHAVYWPVVRDGLEFCKRLVRNPMYPTSSSVELVGKLVHEASIWEQAIRPDSVATDYLAAWMADIAPYRNQPAENDEYQGQPPKITEQNAQDLQTDIDPISINVARNKMTEEVEEEHGVKVDMVLRRLTSNRSLNASRRRLRSGVSIHQQFRHFMERRGGPT
ncbi:hypothetical protein B0H14DRAFT_2615490 [Mycena olivaceomarginata]|nr:hypothetical protein B0H14DRAFT_2615490 [Mycena olivaceomarginata]